MRDVLADLQEFVPTNEAARVAVERARRIVKENNEMIIQLKLDSNIPTEEVDSFTLASKFSFEDTNVFDLYKIKSNNVVSEFFKDIFGAF